MEIFDLLGFIKVKKKEKDLRLPSCMEIVRNGQGQKLKGIELEKF